MQVISLAASLVAVAGTVPAYHIVKRNVECKSSDDQLGDFDTLDACATACAAPHCHGCSHSKALSLVSLAVVPSHRRVR